MSKVENSSGSIDGDSSTKMLLTGGAGFESGSLALDEMEVLRELGRDVVRKVFAVLVDSADHPVAGTLSVLADDFGHLIRRMLDERTSVGQAEQFFTRLRSAELDRLEGRTDEIASNMDARIREVAGLFNRILASARQHVGRRNTGIVLPLYLQGRVAIEKGICIDGVPTATKVLLPGEATDEERHFMTLFGVAERMVRLPTHPHLQRVFSTERIGNRVTMVVEKLGAHSLRNVLEDCGMDMTLESVQMIGCSVAKGLAHLHEHHVLHGNVDSGSIHMGSDGRVVLVDPTNDTLSAGLWNRAPERCRRKDEEIPEARRYLLDIYAFGILLYELVTRKPLGNFIYQLKDGYSEFKRMRDSLLPRVLARELKGSQQEVERLLALLKDCTQVTNVQRLKGLESVPRLRMKALASVFESTPPVSLEEVE